MYSDVICDPPAGFMHETRLTLPQDARFTYSVGEFKVDLGRVRLIDLRKMRPFLARRDVVKIKVRLGKTTGLGKNTGHGKKKSDLLNSKSSQIAFLEQ